MNTIVAQIEEWGDSLGVAITPQMAEENKLKIGDKVEMLLLKKSNIIAESFGQLKDWKKPTDQIMKEIDQELWRE